MIAVPAVPPLPPVQSSQSQLVPRYEDVTQDGRLALNALVHMAGGAVWEQLLSRHPFTAEIRTTGVIPILSRMVLEAGNGPFSVAQRLALTGHYQLAHSRSPSGDVSRIYMRYWIDGTGHVDHTRRGAHAGGPQKVAIVPAGRAFVEHIFTRLFAPPDQRRVTAVSWPGETPVPPARIEDSAPEETWTLPPGLEPLDAHFVPQPTPLIFGLMHTDSNQHVNSLVYTRVFEEVCVAHLHTLGIRKPLLGRALRIAYRKPCFAGESIEVRLQAYRRGEEYLVNGYLVGARSAEDSQQNEDRPRVYVQMHFSH